LKCTGVPGGKCSYRVTETVVEQVKGRKLVALAAKKVKPKLVSKTVTIASASLAVLNNKTGTLTLTLNANGRALLAAHLRFPALLTITETAGGHTRLISKVKLTISRPPVKRRR